MMDSSTSAFVYIDELVDSKVPIYVRNVCEQRGIVVVTLSDNNNTHREIIPNTKYPICLSSKATPDMIRNSRSLRQFLDRGVLEFVPYKEAEAELLSSDVREALADAYDRISPSSRKVSANKSPVNATDDDFDGPSVDDGDGVTPDASIDATDRANAYANRKASAPDDLEIETDDDPESAGVATRVQTLVSSLLSKDLRSRQVKSELMSLDLTKRDLSYLIDKTQGIVQRYAKERFSELTSGHTEKV